MKNKEVDTYIKIQPQLQSAYDEISLLSRKNPTESLNKFKLRFINSILERSNNILRKQYMPFPVEFELFDEEDMPNNGDVIFMLSHYLTALGKLRSSNIRRSGHEWYWVIDGRTSDRKA